MAPVEEDKIYRLEADVEHLQEDVSALKEILLTGEDSIVKTVVGMRADLGNIKKLLFLIASSLVPILVRLLFFH